MQGQMAAYLKSVNRNRCLR